MVVEHFFFIPLPSLYNFRSDDPRVLEIPQSSCAAEKISTKKDQRYDTIMRYLRVKLSFLSLSLKSTFLCLRGTHRGKGNLGSREDIRFTLDELGLWVIVRNMNFLHSWENIGTLWKLYESAKQEDQEKLSSSTNPLRHQKKWGLGSTVQAEKERNTRAEDNTEEEMHVVTTGLTLVDPMVNIPAIFAPPGLGA